MLGEPLEPEPCKKCGCDSCECVKQPPQPCPVCGKRPCECPKEKCPVCGKRPCQCQRRAKLKIKLADGKARTIQHIRNLCASQPLVEAWMQMIKHRIELSHTYNDDVAAKIMMAIQLLYLPAFDAFQRRFLELEKEESA